MAKGNSKVTPQAATPAAPAVDTSTPRKMSRQDAEGYLPKIDDAVLDVRQKNGKPVKVTKQAEDFFGELLYESGKFVDAWGDQEEARNVTSWNSVYANDDQEWLTERSGKGIQALINSRKTMIVEWVAFGIISVDEGRKRMKALQMVQRTLNNHAKQEREEGLWR